MVATGTVKWFNLTKGCGFIQPQDGGRDVFANVPAFVLSNGGAVRLSSGRRKAGL
jgi:CspA family cold shock protein